MVGDRERLSVGPAICTFKAVMRTAQVHYQDCTVLRLVLPLARLYYFSGESETTCTLLQPGLFVHTHPHIPGVYTRL